MARKDLLAILLDSDGNQIGTIYRALPSGEEPPDEEPPDEEPPDEEPPDEGGSGGPTAPGATVDPSAIDVPGGERYTVGRRRMKTVPSPFIIAGAADIAGELRIQDN